MVLLVFSHQQSPCTWSLPYLYEQDTLQAKCGRSSSISQIFTSEGFEPIKPKSKLKTKMGLAEEGDITIRGTTTGILVFRANQGTRSMNFIRSSPVWRTYNTEPSSKELAWGRSTLRYLGHYSFPFCFNFSFFSIVKKVMNETK